MEQHPGLPSARSAIEYVCRLLKSYGIDSLTPELIRQAKFNSATALHPLLQALHDLALCTAAGLPHGCAEGMRNLRQQTQQESIDGDMLPAAGVLLLLHFLSQWGCPAGLVAQLSLILYSIRSSNEATSNSIGSTNSSHEPGSRVCLLCLAWLIGHAQLFDRALQHLQIPGPLLQLLPPYPEDTSCTAAAQAKYTAAATAAQQHAEAVQQLLTPQTAAASDGSCWQQVQAAAHHLLSMYRAVSLRLQLLSSLLDSREKLLHEIKDLQLCSLNQQQQPREGGIGLLSRPISMPNSSGSKVLTAFELHLLSDAHLLQQHQQALQQGCSLLQQQLQCVQAAQMFFAWAASVLDEEQKQQSAQPFPAAQPAAADTSRRMQGSTAVHSSRAASHSRHQQHSTRQLQQQQPPWDVLPQPSVADVLPLVQQLPPANTAVAAQVLKRICHQLEQAASAAGIPTGSSSSSTRGVRSPDATSTALAGLSLGMVASGLQPGSTSSSEDIANRFIATYVKTATAAMIDSKLIPGPQAELLQLPDDIMQQLSKHQQQQQANDATTSARSDSLKKLVWHRKKVTAEHLSMLTARLQLAHKQPLQQQQHAVDSACILPGVDEIDTSAAADVQSVPITAELQRLQLLAVHVAKQLARVRATNKQQLQVASELLGLTEAAAAGSDSRGGSSSAAKLVVYKK